MSVAESIQAYVARQPHYTWRRHLLRGFIRWLGFKVLWRVEASGLEHIPPSGPTILMMNHMSLLDPVLLMGLVQPRFVIPMSKIENSRHPIIGPPGVVVGAYTVNRDEFDRRAVMNSIELVKSGQLILIAPEGTRNPDGLHEAKEGLAFIATKADAVIVPIGITGAVGWQHKLRRLQRPHIRVQVGRPFRFKVDGRANREHLAAMTAEAMYQLALTLPDATLRGHYADVSQATTQHLEFV